MFLRHLAKKFSDHSTKPFTSRTRLKFLAISSSVSLGIFAASPELLSAPISQSHVALHTKLDVAAALKTLKTDNAYNTSVALYAASLLNDSKLYMKSLNEISAQLKAMPDNSFKAWMLGRILLAAKNMNDETTVKNTRFHLKNILQQEIVHDEYRAWALGYLATLNPEEYKNNKDEMIKAANALTKPSDALWAHVMNLQAAAKAGDRDTFELILTQMEKITHGKTVTAALSQIPADDWQAWAMGITLESAVFIGDIALYRELEPTLLVAINEAVRNKSIANAMLAQISANNARILMPSRQVKRN